jgi:hypothetical protein
MTANKHTESSIVHSVGRKVYELLEKWTPFPESIPAPSPPELNLLPDDLRKPRSTGEMAAEASHFARALTIRNSLLLQGQTAAEANLPVPGPPGDSIPVLFSRFVLDPQQVQDLLVERIS